MAMERDADFAIIQRALDEFNSGVGRAQADQTQTKETLAAVEYELDQLRKIVAENALPLSGGKAFARSLSDVEILGEDVGGGPLRRIVDRAA